MKPVIGIVSRTTLRDNGVRLDSVNMMSRRAIIKNGGIPIGILPTQDINYYDTLRDDLKPLTKEEKENIIAELKLCDGVFMQGGNRWYEYDEFIINYCIENDIPCLGICMSMQLLNAVELYKHGIESIRESVGGHKTDEVYAHDVNISEDSILYKILGKNKIKVNSLHKYAIKDSKINIAAVSEDGVIEAIEYPNKRFIVGLQWHPEKMIDYDQDANKIISYFINMAKK